MMGTALPLHTVARGLAHPSLPGEHQVRGGPWADLTEEHIQNARRDRERLSVFH